MPSFLLSFADGYSWKFYPLDISFWECEEQLLSLENLLSDISF